MEWTGGGRRKKKKTNSPRCLGGRGRPILGEKGEEVIDGTSVMVQPSISRTYTFIIYYPRRYGYFASGTSCFSLPPPPPPPSPIPPRCCFLLVATPDASAKPKGRPVTKQPFPRPSIRPSTDSPSSILDRFSPRFSIDFRSIFENSRFHSNRKFETKISSYRPLSKQQS